MRILLIRINSAADEIIPPISLGYLAGTVTPSHEVVILDCLKERCGPEKARELAPRFDAAGITLFTKDLVPGREYLQALKEGNPSIKTFVGGPHPSAMPQETLTFYGALCDVVFVGESELSFPQLLRHYETGQPHLSEINGLCYQTGTGIATSSPDCIENLDASAVAWDLIPPASYPEAPHGAFYRQFPVAPIITSRGCPFHCTFCAGHLISGRKMRQRSVDSVIEEIERLHTSFGVREIHIEDDNFTFSKPYVLDFCRKLSERVPGISWTCPNGVRIDTLDREMIAAMRASGCYALSIGVESGSNRILRLMKKSLSVEKIRDKLNLISDMGVDINAFFILGFPGETKKDIEETIRFALSLPLKRASFANFQPFPGTEAYDALIKDGALTIAHWEHFNPSLQSTIWSPPGITTGELAWFRRKALMRFYFRPRIVFDFVKGINSVSHFMYIVKRVSRWLLFTGKKRRS